LLNIKINIIAFLIHVATMVSHSQKALS